MGAIRGVLLGLAFWAILGLIWLLGGCAPIIQVRPCECDKLQWGDYPADIGPDGTWTFSDGCNTCTCNGMSCSCTAMACSDGSYYLRYMDTRLSGDNVILLDGLNSDEDFIRLEDVQ